MGGGNVDLRLKNVRKSQQGAFVDFVNSEQRETERESQRKKKNLDRAYEYIM